MWNGDGWRDGVLVVTAERQTGIVKRILLKRAGVEWVLEVKPHTIAVRLVMASDSYEQIEDMLLSSVREVELEWYAASNRQFG